MALEANIKEVCLKVFIEGRNVVYAAAKLIFMARVCTVSKPRC